MEQNIAEQIIQIVEKYSKVKVDRKELDQDFIAHYGIDSLVRVRILVEVEKTFNLDIPEEIAFSLKSINDVTNYIQNPLIAKS